MEFSLEGFQLEEFDVKVKGNLVTVTAEHKEEKDGLYSSSKIRRAFTLPKNVNPDQLSSRLGESGCLCLTAPIVETVEYAPEERQLAIQHEDTPAIENSN